MLLQVDVTGASSVQILYIILSVKHHLVDDRQVSVFGIVEIGTVHVMLVADEVTVTHIPLSVLYCQIFRPSVTPNPRRWIRDLFAI